MVQNFAAVREVLDIAKNNEINSYLDTMIFYTKLPNAPEFAGLGSSIYEQRKKIFGSQKALELWERTLNQYNQDLTNYQQGKTNPLSNSNIENLIVGKKNQDKLKLDREQFYQTLRNWRDNKISFNRAFLKKYTPSSRGIQRPFKNAVSYTHLTLPTKRIV